MPHRCRRHVLCYQPVHNLHLHQSTTYQKRVKQNGEKQNPCMLQDEETCGATQLKKFAKPKANRQHKQASSKEMLALLLPCWRPHHSLIATSKTQVGRSNCATTAMSLLTKVLNKFIDVLNFRSRLEATPR